MIAGRAAKPCFLASNTYNGTYWRLFTPKKLTITVDADVYNGLHSLIGRRRISRLLNNLARAYLTGHDIAAGYAAIAADEAREAEALAWSENLVPDIAHEPHRGGG